MTKHALDPLSAFFGTVFVLVGGVFLFTDVEVGDLDWSWGAPLLALMVGLAFLLAAVRRTDRG